MAEPLITVGIAFCNPGTFFETALKSVFAQSVPNWELILLDDGSSDRSVTLAESLTDSRVRVYSDGMRRGLAPRLNQMVALARGDIFVRMDADDVMHPRRLERQQSVLRSCSANTVIGTAAFSIDEHSRVLGRRKMLERPGTGFAARRTFIHPTVAGYSEWFRKNPYSEEPVYLRAEDAELWCRTAGHTEFRILNEELLFYREFGPWSYRKYLGSAIGSICLLTEQFSTSRLNYSAALTRELMKIWITSVLEATGHQGWLVSKRYSELEPNEQKDATAILSAIDALELPISEIVPSPR